MIFALKGAYSRVYSPSLILSPRHFLQLSFINQYIWYSTRITRIELTERDYKKYKEAVKAIAVIKVNTEMKANYLGGAFTSSSMIFFSFPVLYKK